ncbi:MAG: hypothetical protein JSS20_04055 [Proteobacteria bacterium]|nr:hypothetical protein [Pseudomonadota bacterium]
MAVKSWATVGLTAGALVAVLVGASVAAEPPDKSDAGGRFAMQPTDGGILRLDTATGDVSLCARQGGTFECKPVKDDRDLQSEIARLSTENKELKAEIKRLEDMLGLNGGPGAPKPGGKFELPSEEDVDKALSYMERMIKKFRDKFKDLEQGEKKGTPL